MQASDGRSSGHGSQEKSRPPRDRDVLRIGVNLWPLTTRGGGMRHYVLQLLPWLARLSGHRFLLFHGPHGQPSLAPMLRRLAHDERRRLRPVEVESQEEIYAHAHRFDVFFCPLNALAPDLLDRPTLATLADVQEQFFPQYFTAEQLATRSWLYPRTARAATILFTLSEFSKRSICERFGVSPDKVRVAYLAPDDEMLHAAPEWPCRLPPLLERFVFYPANLYPHKNHEILLQAVRILRDRGIDCACVLTGHPTQPGTAIEERIAAHGLRDRVLWLGHVAPAALRHLYEHAVALCFPSQFEGFGMPLVEAMHCGCPILATPVASIPEVVGDAGLLVPPSAAALADAVGRLIAEPRLREELAAKGRARAGRFSARSLAETTLRAIGDAVAAFTESRTAQPSGRRMSYVVRASAGGPALARTLASLCYEACDDDEVLVIGDRRRLGARVLALCDNLEAVQFIPPSDWIEAVGNETVCYLREGDHLREGATRAALDALAEEPQWQAVVGEALAVDARGQYRAGLFVPRRSLPLFQGAVVPPAVVFWRRDYLLQHRAMLGQDFQVGPLLALARGRIGVLERTLAAVETAVEAGNGGPGLARRLAGCLARAARRFPSAKRAVVQFLPRRVEAALCGWYFGTVRPQDSRG
jgi:glycosyltransferase involved in cell wall biosynthesis